MKRNASGTSASNATYGASVTVRSTLPTATVGPDPSAARTERIALPGVSSPSTVPPVADARAASDAPAPG
jgi:hypothetical protein